MKINKPIIFAFGLIIIALLPLTGCSSQKLSGDAITTKVFAEKSQSVSAQGSPASVIGNIEAKKEKSAAGELMLK